MNIFYSILILSGIILIFILTEYVLSKNEWNLLYRNFKEINIEKNKFKIYSSRLKFGANFLKGTRYPFTLFKISKTGIIISQPFHFCCHKKIFIPYSHITEIISINDNIFYSYKIIVKLKSNHLLTLFVNYDVGTAIKHQKSLIIK